MLIDSKEEQTAKRELPIATNTATRSRKEASQQVPGKGQLAPEAAYQVSQGSVSGGSLYSGRYRRVVSTSPADKLGCCYCSVPGYRSTAGAYAPIVAYLVLEVVWCLSGNSAAAVWRRFSQTTQKAGATSLYISETYTHHAVCKVKFQPFSRLYSQMTFSNYYIKKLLLGQNTTKQDPGRTKSNQSDLL